MLKCKTCGNIFSAKFVADIEEFQNKSKNEPNLINSFSIGHSNQYVPENYIDLSCLLGLIILLLLVVIQLNNCKIGKINDTNTNYIYEIDD